MKSYLAKNGEVKAQWRVVDLTGKVLGRAATKIATMLMGKHRPEYTPHVDTGDFIVIVNADKVKFSDAKKQDQMTYERYSGYPGGRRVIPLKEMAKKHPTAIIREAVRRMLPKSRLGKQMLTKLKVYAGPTHPHQAQNPQTLEL